MKFAWMVGYEIRRFCETSLPEDVNDRYENTITTDTPTHPHSLADRLLLHR